MSSADLPIGIFTTDDRLVVRTWDAWLVTSTGLATRDVLGRPVTEVIPELAERALLPILESVLANGTVQVLAPALHHYLIPCKTSRPSPLFDRMQQHVTIGPLRDRGRILGVIVAIEDVTARIEQERAWSGKLGAEASTGRHVESLTRLLGDDDWRARQTAVTTLAKHGNAIVDALVRTLREQHQDFNVLSSALDVLAISDVDVVSPLLPLLEDPDANLRIQVALILGVRGDARAIPALVARLSDPDPNVRFHVIEAIGNLRASEATDMLLRIAEQRDFFLAYPAIVALGRIGNASVAPFLAPLLTDELLRAPVIEALGLLGDEDVCIPLVSLLNMGDAPADVVADALAGLYERYESRYGAGEHIAALVRRHMTAAGTQNILDAVQEVGPDRLPGLARVLGWLEGEAVQRALARLLGHEAVQAQVVEALVRYGAGVVALLVEQLGAEDLDTRQAAAVALGRIGDRRATPALIKSLADPELALLAAGALARIGDADAFEALLPLIGHEDSAIRQSAIGALNSIGHADMPQRICHLLDSPDPIVRESALKIAGYFGYEECIDRVLECCGSEVEAVRRSAVEHLAYFEDSRVHDQVLQALGHDTAAVRAVAVTALARLGAADSTHLVRALRDPDPWVRHLALRAVGSLRNLDAVPAVIATLEQDQAGQVRVAALEAIGCLKPAGAFEILQPFARSDDEDLARTAIRALGGLDSSEALSALEAFLRAPERWRRCAAIEAMAMRPEPEVVATLEWRAAADEDEAVIAAAFEALVQVATREGRQGSEAARRLLELATEPSRRQSAIASLSLLPAWRIPDVADGLRHRTIEGRQAAVEALGRMKHPEASKVLEKALDDGVAIVRLTAVAELKHLGIRWCERKLMTLARTDPDAEVRCAAMMAVARVADNAR